MEHKLEIDVYAHWSDNPPIYRIYVNDEMLVERTFGWPSYQNYITEHMYCELDTGVHTLNLENLDTIGRFDLNNFLVNGNPVNKNLLKSNGSKIEWRFIVDHLLQNSNQNNYVSNELNQIAVSVAPASVPDKPKVNVQPKKYETYIPLIQRSRELNNRITKNK